MVATSAGNMVFGDGAGQVADIEIGVDNQTAIIPGPYEWRGAAAGHDDRRAACCRLHTNHYLDTVLARYGSICGARREYVGTSQARVLLLFSFCFLFCSRNPTLVADSEPRLARLTELVEQRWGEHTVLPSPCIQ